jgi:hypothetical protein
MSEWELENEALLKKIGQVAPATPKPASNKKDEE